MPEWINKKIAAVADTVYSNRKLVARDVAFTIGGISFQTSEVQAMGTVELPLIGLIENMDLTVTKIGIDEGLGRLSSAEKMDLEFRWVQSIVKADGTTGPEGCKAFIRCVPKQLGDVGVEIGSGTEIENTYTITRVQIFYGGTEYILVDRFAGKLRINGRDYMGSINKLL